MKIRRLVKISIWTVTVLVVLVIGAGTYLYFHLNSIVRKTIETQATSSLNLTTTLQSADVGVFSGSLKLDQFRIGSPSGFKAPAFFDLNQGSVAVTWGNMFKKPVRIKQIILTSPKLVIEQAMLKFNIQAAMDGMPKTQSTEPMKLIIDELQINNASVVFMPGVPGLTNEMSIKVPNLTLKNIGNADGNQNGEAINKVAMMAITALAGKAAEIGGLPTDLNKALDGVLKNVSGQLGAQFDKQFKSITSNLTKNLPGQAGKALQGATKDLQKNLDGSAKDLTKGLEGVLPGGKKGQK